MRGRAAAWLLWAALAAAPACARSDAIALPQPGAELFSPSRQCFVKVLEDPSDRTLRARLYARERLVGDVKGAREMAWIGEALVFAVSPAFARPGIYVWDCPKSTVRRVVKPSRSNLAHPGGTDFYQLVEIDGDILYYAHAPDVDSPSLEQDLERGIETLRLRPVRPKLSMN